MHPHRTMARTAAWIAASAALTLSLVAPAQAHQGGHDTDVTQWAERHAVAVPLYTDRPGPDLAALGRATRGADIVGLGEAAHGLHELSKLKLRYVKYLVEQRGFRAIAWEEDWTLGTRINDYVLGRRDDVDTVIQQLDPVWRTSEVRETFTWLRQYNDRHREKVQFAGAEYFATRPLAYEAVDAYVAAYAPDQLPRLREDLDLITPDDDDMHAHLTEYMGIPNKESYVQAAARVHDVVAGISPGRRDREHALVLHHARQIRSFYKAFSLPWPEIPAYRDARAAENIRWWQQYTGERVIYWGAGAHAADAPSLTVTQPQQADAVFASAGSYLADWYGRDYVTVGFTLDRGTYSPAAGQIVDLPPAAEGWFEEPLGDVRSAQFLLTLDGAAPRPVRQWLDRPIVTRGLPEYGYDSTMTGGTLREWYDVLVHRQVVTPASRLS